MNNPNLNKERDLAQAIRQGDKQAMRHIYDAYGPRLFALCRRYSHDQSMAEDILQNTFVKAFTSISSFAYKGEGSLRAWLTRIAVNEAISHLRKAVRFAPIEDIDEPPDDGPAPDIGSLSTEQIMSCVSKLPPGLAAVFNLHVVEGFSHKEIAKMLGIQEQASFTRLSRAKKQLITIIKRLYE